MVRNKTPIRWVGGKVRMITKILTQFPSRDIIKVYCEPFGGAGSILWNVEPYPCEVYNDINSDLVNLMRVIQDESTAHQLQDKLKWTLYSRDEFSTAIDILKSNSTDSVSRAWAFYVRQNQGFGGMIPKSTGGWGRSIQSLRGMASQASQYWSRFDTFEFWHQRISKVIIDNNCALKVIKDWDSPSTFFYLDPPYEMSTRKTKMYTNETDTSFHTQLVETLNSLQGKYLLSGYDSPIYSNLINVRKYQWTVTSSCAGTTKINKGEIKRERTECVWRNYSIESDLLQADV